MGFKFLNNLSIEEKQKFLTSFDRVFCDCDGVIWQTLREAIPGSATAIEFLRNKGKSVIFVTNNSISPIEDHIKKFQRCGLNVTEEEILHPAKNITDYLKEINFKGLIYCLGTPLFKENLSKEGYRLVQDDRPKYLNNLNDLRDVIFRNDPVKAIIIDVDLNLNAAMLMRAHVHLKNPECLLIGGAGDTLIPFCNSDIIGPGIFINALEQSTKRKAIRLGKPGEELSKLIFKRYDIKKPERVLFIGDSLNTDIEFGKLCGFQTLLVLSGGTSLEDLQIPIKETERPDYVASCLKELIL